MNKYSIFLEKYSLIKDKEKKEILLKEFLLCLSPDELIAWLKDGNKIIKDNLQQLINSRENSNVQFAKDCLDELESFLQPKSVKKAA